MLNMGSGVAPLNDLDVYGVRVANIDYKNSHVAACSMARLAGATYFDCDLYDLGENIGNIRENLGHLPVRFGILSTDMARWLAGYGVDTGWRGLHPDEYIRKMIIGIWDTLDARSYLIVTEP